MFILASGSPRRAALLRQIGADFCVVVSHAEEIVNGGLSPARLALANAERKARQVAAENEGVAVLGADTIVVSAGRVFGKPQNETEARSILRQLSGKTHRVITAIVFVRGQDVFSDVITTKVIFATVTDDEIERYVATGEPMDKAGGYALQGRAAAFIEGINGSYSNVVGLPLHATVKLAKTAGISLFPAV